jgi:hypothetical protein
MDQSDGSLVPRDSQFEKAKGRLKLKHRVTKLGWKKAYRETRSDGTASSRDTNQIVDGLVMVMCHAT